MTTQEKLDHAEQALQLLAWYADICHMKYQDYGEIAKDTLKKIGVEQRNPNEPKQS